MTKKLTRLAAAELLQIDEYTMHRLALLTDSDGINHRVELVAWAGKEYTERDNFVFRLCQALKPHLSNIGDVFSVIYAMRIDIDRLIAQSRKHATAGVVVIGDSRYVKWPGYEDWFDLWDVLRAKSCRSVEPSLHITTAIHLYTVITPLVSPEQ